MHASEADERERLAKRDALADERERPDRRLKDLFR
jgi:hypothetical protein